MKRYFLKNFLLIFALAVLVMIIQTGLVALRYGTSQGNWRDEAYFDFVDTLEEKLDGVSTVYLGDRTIQNFLNEVINDRISGLLISDTKGNSIVTMGNTPAGVPMGANTLKKIEISSNSTIIDITNGEVTQGETESLTYSVVVPSAVDEKDIVGTVVISVNGTEMFTVHVLSFTPINYEYTKTLVTSCIRALLVSIPLCIVVAFVAALLFSRKNTKQINSIRESLNNLTNGLENVDVKHFRDKELDQIPNAIEELDKSLQANKKSRSVWLASISHDLSTPLTAVQMLVEGMYDKVIPMTKANLESLNTEVRGLSERVNRVIEFSSLQATVVPKIEEFDAVDLVNGLEEKFPEIKVDCLVEKIKADKALITKACDEILKNATAFDPKSTLKIEEKEGKCFIEVRNKGKLPEGIKPDDLFEPWTRGDSARNSNGNGLGLPIVGAIVALHNGRALIRQEAIYVLTILEF